MGRHTTVFLLWIALLVGGLEARVGEAAESFTLRVAVQDASAIGRPAEVHGATWAAKRQAGVDVKRIPFGALYESVLASLKGEAPPFDVIFYAPAWAGDFAPYLRELPPWVAEDESFDDIHPIFRDRLMKWNDHWVSITVDGDLFSGYYRRDLFEDPVSRAGFLARYGYDLLPPATWDQYRDIAEFFTGRPGPDGRPLFGAAEAFARGKQQFWTAFARAAAYTNAPGVSGAQFFDPDTMVPQVNNPGWVRAIEDYVAVLAFCPPEARSFGIVESRQAFIDGQAALTLDWGDTGPAAEDPARSKVADKVGYFVLPGAAQVWNPRLSQWIDVPRGRRVPYLAFGGWVAAVPRNAPHPEAAWDFILWFSSVANSLEDVLDGGTGINPYRYSHFAEIDAWTRVFSRRAAAEYLGVIKTSLDSPNAALDLRLPGFKEYTDAFEAQMVRVLAGEIAVKPALDAVALAWEGITERYGRASQKALYRASMGLAPE
ncbi:extracellular solute-binding protein [Pararhodospirillum photometricum]|uniref:Putative ABC-type sugar transport system,periplasmic component n=1 Tax=Pararhodospirillum photometricum DSM 122 TaxID=1150469 RepID=H6SPC4_PARPM|nr:extracellular solute-binding protein [Pararhodospirillum photometricum]CCG09449.1 Putative ABC-type sugar transport system,periplasmic component [Pararhodospirillum photometricum DSM 122]